MIDIFGLYKITPSQLPAKYNWWVPVFDKNKELYLISTYCLDKRYAIGYENNPRIALLEINRDKVSMQEYIDNATYKFKVTSDIETQFTKVCTLDKFWRVPREDLLDYNKEDYVMNVTLYRGQNDDEGIDLRRIDAEKNLIFEIEHAIDDIQKWMKNSFVINGQKDKYINRITLLKSRMTVKEYISDEIKENLIARLDLLTETIDKIEEIETMLFREESRYKKEDSNLQKEYEKLMKNKKNKENNKNNKK